MQGNRPETGGHSDPMEMAAALNINRDTIIKQTAFSRLRVRHLHGRTDHVRIIILAALLPMNRLVQTQATAEAVRVARIAEKAVTRARFQREAD